MEFPKRLSAWLAVSLVLGAPLKTSGSGTLSIPQRSNAHVSLAAEGPFVTAVWSATAEGGATDIFAAVSRDGARSFSPAVQVNAVPGDARVTGEQPPRVALVPRQGNAPEMVVMWTTRRPDGTALLTARSIDGGATFTPAAPVPGTPAPGNRGWHAIATGTKGEVRAIWLDHRELEAHDKHAASTHRDHTAHAAGGSQGKADGATRAQRSKLYFSSLGRDAKPHVVTGGVCYCCKTALAVDAAGRLFAAWRHVFAGNMRDIAFTVSADGGRTFAAPVRVSEDAWQLEGCPDDGPTLSVDARGVAHVVWPTRILENGEPTIGLFHAATSDGGRFSSRQRLETAGVPHHPQLAAGAAGAIAVVWDESLAGRRQVVLASGKIGAGGRPQLKRAVLSADTSGSYPAVAHSGPTVVVAWTSHLPGQSVVRVARIPAP
jgi:hypothetical protein